MELGVFDRIILINILPREGDFRTLKILRELRENLAFSEEENEALQFKTADDGLVRWVAEADVTKDVPIGEVAREVIETAFKALDRQKKLREEHLDLYERFVPVAREPSDELVAAGGGA